MKKLPVLVALLCMVICGSSFAQSPAPKIGVGVAGGMDLPLLQDDQASGMIFGAKLRLKVLPMLTVEPNIMFSNYGEPEVDGFDLGIEGAKVTAFGVDGVIGNAPGTMGVVPYFVGGIAFYKWSQDDKGEFENTDTKIGFSGGVGIGIALGPKLQLDGRAKFHLVPIEGDFSRKALTVTAGVNYSF